MRFYTGVPDSREDPDLHRFWSRKPAAMGRYGVKVFSFPLRYRPLKIILPNGRVIKFKVGQEKGVDLRIAVDVIRAVRDQTLDVAVLFTQDQDFSELAKEVHTIASEQKRTVGIASAFPFSSASRYKNGVRGTYWIRIDRLTYEACLDPWDYRA